MTWTLTATFPPNELLFAHRIQEGNLRLRKKPWCSGRTDSNGRAQEREGEMTLIA